MGRTWWLAGLVAVGAACGQAPPPTGDAAGPDAARDAAPEVVDAWCCDPAPFMERAFGPCYYTRAECEAFTAPRTDYGGCYPSAQATDVEARRRAAGAESSDAGGGDG